MGFDGLYFCIYSFYSCVEAKHFGFIKILPHLQHFYFYRFWSPKFAPKKKYIYIFNLKKIVPPCCGSWHTLLCLKYSTRTSQPVLEHSSSPGSLAQRHGKVSVTDTQAIKRLMQYFRSKYFQLPQVVISCAFGYQVVNVHTAGLTNTVHSVLCLD